MGSKIKARFLIQETFLISDRGIVLAGVLQEGSFNIGDSVQFSFENETITRTIKGIELIRSVSIEHKPVKNKMAFLIKCKDKMEEQRLKEWNPKSILATIYGQPTS